VTRPIEAQRFAVVDTETTGLEPSDSRLLQVGVVVTLGDGSVLDEWSSYVRAHHWRPGRLGAHHVHGITRRHLRGGLPLADVLAQLNRRLEGAVFTAHNAPFDLGFLLAAARDANVALAPVPALCTLALARQVSGARGNRLHQVAERYGIVAGGLHDALADARLCAQVLPRLLADADVRTAEQLGPHLLAQSLADTP
jgi:DNA polymerase-3 subunit epsilon